jgi:hypothetical protein
MPDVLTALTALAVSVFRTRADPSELTGAWFNSLLSYDAVLHEAQRMSFLLPDRYPAIEDVIRLALSQPELSVLAPREGELDPMLMHPGGGSRMSAKILFTSLLSSAFLQMYFLRLPQDEGTFVRIVLEGFEELRRAARGERIRAHAVTGIARITLPEGAQVLTPWGVIRPAQPIPAGQFFPLFAQPRTTCILAEPRLLPVRFDRAPSPQPFDPSETTPMRSRVLFPLSCALASKETAKPVVPLLTWSTLLVPFQVGLGYSIPLLPPSFGAEVDVSERIEELEEWARIVDRAHTPSVDIAAGRLVSAVANRMDRSDSLIDAVMVWENLVGTTSEVTFRVTAALAKLLESDPTKRRDLRKELAKIYDIRSRVVHGTTVDAAVINKACSDAIDVAVRALRTSYARGREWLALSSNERADTILLEWQ